MIDTLLDMCQNGEEAKACNFVIESVTDMLSCDMYEDVDDVLASVDVEEFSGHESVLTALVSSTVCASQSLTRRESFKRAAENFFTIKFGEEIAKRLVLDSFDHMTSEFTPTWVSN